MANPVGRPPGLGRVPGSGRKPGTPNSRKLPETVKSDLLHCYKALGGRKFLLDYLRKNPDEMLKALMRFVPVPREEPLVEVNISAQAAALSTQDAAMRIAFALAKAAHDQGIDTPPATRVLTIEPEPAPAETINEPVLPPSAEPVEEGPPVGETYRGTLFEQGRERPSRYPVTKRDRRNLL